MLWDELEKVTWHQDEPFGSASIYAQWNVMRRASERGVTVLLDGQGADELLGGYVDSSSYFWLKTLIKNGHPLRAFSEAKAFSDIVSNSIGKIMFWSIIGYLIPPKYSTLLMPLFPQLKRKDISGNLFQEHKGRRKIPSVYSDLPKELHKRTFDMGLRSLLRYEDKNSSAFSLEARVPFLDYRLVEFIFGLPLDQKMRNGWSKVILRNSMKGIIPENIRLRRDKIGFAYPQLDWLRQTQDKVKSLLTSGNTLTKDYLSIEWIASNLSYCLSQDDMIDIVWRWINLEIWFRVWNL